MPHIHESIDFVVSAYIVFDNNTLLIDHKALGMWLPIGGHIELNEHPEEALFREIEEESGLGADHLIVLKSNRGEYAASENRRALFAPVHLDIHRISPTHQHVALNYFIKSKVSMVVLAAAEHHAIRWFSQQELTDPRYNIPGDVQWYAFEAIKAAQEI